MTGDLWGDMETAQEIALYGWQAEAVEALRANIRAAKERGEFVNQILAAATGSGKTVIASYLINECQTKGKRAVFVCDRIPLIDQTSATFDAYGIPHGVIQADHWRTQPWQKIQVASAQTLARRRWPDDLSLIVVDEAHTIHKSVASRIKERDCVVIGLTATPFTRGLGKHYDAVVTVRTLNQLTADGYLAPYDIWAASEPDMTGAKVVAGEWTEEEAVTRSMPIIGDIVTEYLRHGVNPDGSHKKFIAFGVNVKHCEEIQKQMMAAGVLCGLYTYQTGDEDRAEMIREFQKPDSYLRGLVSVSALSKGFDNPSVEIVIMARPLRSSLAEHIQILGRGLRRDPMNPEKRCIVLDHAGNCVRFYAAMNEFFENGASELDMGKRKEKKKPEAREREPYKCPKCSHVHDPRPMCPACGHEYPRRSFIEHVPGELSQLTGLPAGSGEDKQAFYSQLIGYGIEQGWKPGAAKHRFRERYGVWPDRLAATPAEPNAKTRSWIRSRIIAWHKSRKAA
jgi:DNA repair protein RadD